MQSAETVLGVLRERGRRGLPLEELYRQMFNPQLYLLAYGRIYSNKGAMTPGATGETADGMSAGEIGRIIDAMRRERYRFGPVTAGVHPKKNGKKRPLGLPSWSDKLVGEVMRLLLEAYYEPQFSDRSHGFRPGRGCHTALCEVANTWTGTTWFIEGDIADCFGSFDHEVMLGILAEKIHDNRFLRLMRNMLQAGYLEDWAWHATLSRLAARRGRCRPFLSNHLPAQAGRLRRAGADPRIHPGRAAEAQPGVPQAVRRHRARTQARRPRGRAGSPPAAAIAAQRGPARPRIPAAAVCQVRRRPSSSGSPDRRPKPSRSSHAWRRSCARNSSWSCHRARR